MHVTIDRIVAALGGPQVIKRPITNPLDLITLAEEGLPIESVAYLQRNLGLTNKTMSQILAISESTYQRRIRAKTTMSKDETEKAISLSEVYERGLDLYESQERFNWWLNASIPALGSRKPVDLLDSAIGRQEIIEILGRIEHGIYS